MTQTLHRERRQKFAKVISVWIADSPAITDVTGDALLLEEEIVKLAELLATESISNGEKRTDEDKGDYIAQANKKVDALLDMANFPGAKAEARRASIQSYLGERLHVNTETKAWREFAKYADGQNQSAGEKIEVFIAWLLGQDGFQLQYWPPRRMMEMWPQAFMKPTDKREEYETL
jgi:vacuolar-type H+-ATPase subunit H